MSSNNNKSRNATFDGVELGGTLTLIHVYKYSEIVLAIAGTLLNLWFLVAILTSRDMRSRLRNKIICNIFVVHLLDCAIIAPAGIVTTMTDWSLGCVFYSAFGNLYLIQDFIINWLLVMLLVVFIAQIQDFNPRIRLTPRAVTLGTLGLLVLPWVASLVVVPIIVHQYNVGRYSAHTDCFLPTLDSYQIFKSVDTALPILLAVLLVIVAAALRYRLITRRYSSEAVQTELINRGAMIDNTFAYVTAVVISIICDLLQLVICLNVDMIYKYDFLTKVNIGITADLMSDARVVLMPLPWLILADVRQRITTWRPWSHSITYNELTVTYINERN